MGHTSVIAVGECMLEIAWDGGGWRLGHGGDTFNTALYLCRLGVPVAYLTALGTDSFSENMRAAWIREGIDVSLVLTDPARLPGLYAIVNDPDGERHFHYWRERSAVRQLFALEGIRAAIERACRADLLYFSGITLSIFAEPERARLVEIAAAVHARGGQVAFDPNYRPAGWIDASAARTAMEVVAPAVSVAMPTFADEAVLFGDASPEQTVERWQRWGVAEVIVKLGARGCLATTGAHRQYLPVAKPVTAIDGTGAGDAFNAAYLASRLAGRTPFDAARAANLLGAEVVQYPGAIVPFDRMKELRTRLDI